MGAQAMDAEQTEIEVTGQNLSNISNPAYSRQVVNLETAPDVPTAVGPEGTGVEVASISQVRSSFLDSQGTSRGERGRILEFAADGAHGRADPAQYLP